MTYEELGAEIGKLVETKQAAYGDAFGKSGEVMRILYPDGIPVEKLDDALTVVRVLDKLFRIATSRDALGESPWRDIAGYALLSAERAQNQEKTPEQKPCGDLCGGACEHKCTLPSGHGGACGDVNGAFWS